MTSAQRPWLAATAAALISVLTGGAVVAQTSEPGLELIKGGRTPVTIEGLQILNSMSCPLLVKPTEAQKQPLWISPSQVAAKNKLGCLSPADAIYGPDGCPRQLCRAGQGAIPLPGQRGGTPPAL
ncbi:MAG: hypothetical protein RLZZ611_278 [Cyanobacteriota bacterium]|jgi:hypothetical protein